MNKQQSFSQNYVFLYCKYDAEKGARNWKELLQQEAVKQIDLEIALAAFEQEELPNQITRIIYYGSPYAQELEELQRIDYAISIVNEAQKARRDTNWFWVKPDTIGYVLIDGCFKGYLAINNKVRANKYLKYLNLQGSDSLRKGKLLSSTIGLKVVGKYVIEIVSFNPEIAIKVWQDLSNFDLSKDPDKQTR